MKKVVVSGGLNKKGGGSSKAETVKAAGRGKKVQSQVNNHTPVDKDRGRGKAVVSGGVSKKGGGSSKSQAITRTEKRQAVDPSTTRPSSSKRPSSTPPGFRPEKRQNLITPQPQAVTSQQVQDEEGTPSPVSKVRSNNGSSNNSQPSPPSQGTHVSQSMASSSRTLPQQYTYSQSFQSVGRPHPSRLTSDQNLNLNLRPVREEILNREEDIDEDEGDIEEDEDNDEEDQDEDNAEEDQAEDDAEEDQAEPYQPPRPIGEDDQLELNRLLALPGRSHLPLLSVEPVRESLWFTRDHGKLTRVISSILRRRFKGPWFSWTVTPQDQQEFYFRTFVGKYQWDISLTELVRENFWEIATNRLKDMVSKAKKAFKKGGERPVWIEEPIWNFMWLRWKTKEFKRKSAAASKARNSDRNGLGPHRHRTGQSSYLTIQQDLEASLGRPVSFAEVFRLTHTGHDGSFIDRKAKQVYEAYEQEMAVVIDQVCGEEPEALDCSTQRQLTVDEQNAIFLKVTHIDLKGNAYGLGKMSKVRKGKKKVAQASAPTAQYEEVQEQLHQAIQKIAVFEEENKRRDEADKLRDAANARRDADDKRRDDELRESKARLTEFEKLVSFLKEDNPRIAAHMTQASSMTTTPPATSSPQSPQANG